MESKLYLNSFEAQKAQQAETAGTIAQAEKKPEKKEPLFKTEIEETGKIAQGTPSGTPAETAGTIAQGATTAGFSALA